MGPERLSTGSAEGALLFDAVGALIEVIAGGTPLDVRPSKSQVAFRRRRGFASDLDDQVREWFELASAAAA